MICGFAHNDVGDVVSQALLLALGKVTKEWINPLLKTERQCLGDDVADVVISTNKLHCHLMKSKAKGLYDMQLCA